MGVGFLRAAVSVALLATSCACAHAQTGENSGGTVKIGVLTDMTGVFSDLAGGGAVTAAQMAIDDFVESERPSFKIEAVSVYHQNKPDIATGIARQWYDTSTSMTDAATWTVATLTNTMPKPRLDQTRTSSDLDVMSAGLLITDSTRTSFNVAEGPTRDNHVGSY